VTDAFGQTTLADRSSPVDGARIAEPTRPGGWHELRGPTEREPAGHVHAGVDVHGAPGTPVLAPEAGVVERVGTLPARAPWTGYAPAVLLRGDSGRWHLLAHLSGGPLLVVADQRVTLRQPVGTIGHERHVHWEVRTRPLARPARGELAATITIDPRAWLEGREEPTPAGPQSPPLDPQRGPLRSRRNVEVLTDAAWLAVCLARDWQPCSFSR
jgi:murein DD-endopeptidase MepM/ murein hydrolase activator NlpD